VLQKTEYIWFDGNFIRWDDAKVHVLTYTLHYGLGVFEGIRVYRCSGGFSAVFRLADHIKRLIDSAKIVGINIGVEQGELEEAVIATLKKNSLEEGYIRPIIFVGEGDMGLYAYENPVHIVIAVWPWGTYLGEEGLKNGIRAKTSSFTRHHINSSMTKAKICGYYVNSILAKKEAKEAGYDEAIILDAQGCVSEGAGENIFMVTGGKLKTTPPETILPGITRDTVITLAREMGIEVIEQKFTRDSLYISDEVFLTGTAAEITPIWEIDGRRIGRDTKWPITRRLQERFFKMVRGEDEVHLDWLSLIRF
jgi:branched-chain amino acid aminotransferase